MILLKDSRVAHFYPHNSVPNETRMNPNLFFLLFSTILANHPKHIEQGSLRKIPSFQPDIQLLLMFKAGEK